MHKKIKPVSSAQTIDTDRKKHKQNHPVSNTNQTISIMKKKDPIDVIVSGSITPAKMIEKGRLLNGDFELTLVDGSSMRIEGPGPITIEEAGGRMWDTSMKYDAGDIVSWKNRIFIASKQNKACEPGSALENSWIERDLVGPIGPDGIEGQEGPVGPIGRTGITGDKGDKGDQGDQGLVGIMGPSGPEGPIGPIGITGNTGADGAAIVGPQGVAGPKGIDGAKGEKGDKGPIGHVGSPGGNGADGKDGTGVRILGQHLIKDILAIKNAIAGDMYLATDEDLAANPPGIIDDCYVWTGTKWDNVGPIRGPKGEIGISVYSFYDASELSIIPGHRYDTAIALADLIYNGVNYTRGDMLVYDGSVWNLRGTILGPDGAQGIQGIQGIQGPKGDIGPKGTDFQNTWTFDGTTLRVTIK